MINTSQSPTVHYKTTKFNTKHNSDPRYLNNKVKFCNAILRNSNENNWIANLPMLQSINYYVQLYRMLMVYLI